MKLFTYVVALVIVGLTAGAAQAESRLDAPGCKLALPDNRFSAENFYQKKANSGDACAQLNLGAFFYTHESFEAAAYWYGEAAKLGNIKAQFELALLYRDGLGNPKNLAKAAQWMQKSAEQGMLDAQSEIGVMYYAGTGVKQDDVKAEYWLTKAANQGKTDAQFNLGLLYRTDLRGVEDGSSEQAHFTHDDRTALHWFCKAAKQGDSRAQFQVGDAYKQGRGIDVDYAQVRLWFRMAAAQGNDNAVAWLASDNDMSDIWYKVAEKWIKLQALRFKKPIC